MSISIKTTNIELTEALRDYTERRIEAVSKITGDAVIAVEIGKESNHHHQGDIFLAEIRIAASSGGNYYATSKKDDLYAAIDDVRDEILATILSQKGKKESLIRRGARRIKQLLQRR